MGRPSFLINSSATEKFFSDGNLIAVEGDGLADVALVRDIHLVTVLHLDVAGDQQIGVRADANPKIPRGASDIRHLIEKLPEFLASHRDIFIPLN